MYTEGDRDSDGTETDKTTEQKLTLRENRLVSAVYPQRKNHRRTCKSLRRLGANMASSQAIYEQQFACQVFEDAGEADCSLPRSIS